MAFISSMVLAGPFDAVLPLHLKRIFDFTALTSGAMFAALAVPEIILGPVAGLIVDKYGSKLAALIGFVSLCPALFLLVVPSGPATPRQITILVAILLFNGYTNTVWS
jgi:nitrate/nitrite transporter NarK